MRIKVSTTKEYLKDLVYRVNGAAIEVHKRLGPGLLESVYHKCLEYELYLNAIPHESELNVPVNYRDKIVRTDLRCDFLVDSLLVVEIKAVEYVLPVHEAQIITYMKLLEAPMGLMINFNCTHIFKEGQKTYVNEIYRGLSDK